jgi:hypothetical protein
VKGTSQPQITPVANGTHNSIATSSSFPAIAANQTLWVRGIVSQADTRTQTAGAVRVQMNGTTMFTVNGWNRGGD